MAKIDVNKIKKSTKQVVDKQLKTINKTVKTIEESDTLNNLKENADKTMKAVSSFASSTKENIVNKKAEIVEASSKKSLDEILQDSINQYNSTYDVLNAAGIELHYQRQRSIDVIDFVENLVNSIANKPKSFDTDFEEISTSKKTFKDADNFMKKELAEAKKQAVGAGAGIAAGTGVVALAPAGAMWVATTFGTASTGTAISALSGAAATNAALAWLGGGALTAGGGGMAAGQAFLTLAGPIGWGIAGVSILASVALFANNKRKTNREKDEEINAIKNNTNSLKITIGEISTLTEETNMLREQLSNQLKCCNTLYGLNYIVATEEQKKALGTLVNNTRALSQLITKKLNLEDKNGEQ